MGFNLTIKFCTYPSPQIYAVTFSIPRIKIQSLQFEPTNAHNFIAITIILVYNEVEQWYVRHTYFIVLYHRLHVSTYIQVIFRPSFAGKSIKCYTCWDPRRPEDALYIGRNM